MTSDFRPSGWRLSCAEPLEIAQPELDEGADAILEPGLARERQRLLVALPDLLRSSTLLEPVVAGYEQFLDSLADVSHSADGYSGSQRPYCTPGSRMEPARQLPTPIRVLIADDHQLFAEALSSVLADDDRIEVVGKAHDGRTAVECALELKPDVVLMDISMPVMDGFEATRRIREREQSICVLMLTGSDSPLDVDRARQAGVSGYVTKDKDTEQLIAVIMDVAAR
jgi:CheY-like chemotaxis protein